MVRCYRFCLEDILHVGGGGYTIENYEKWGEGMLIRSVSKGIHITDFLRLIFIIQAWIKNK